MIFYAIRDEKFTVDSSSFVELIFILVETSRFDWEALYRSLNERECELYLSLL